MYPHCSSLSQIYDNDDCNVKRCDGRWKPILYNLVCKNMMRDGRWKEQCCNVEMYNGRRDGKVEVDGVYIVFRKLLQWEEEGYI